MTPGPRWWIVTDAFAIIVETQAKKGATGKTSGSKGTREQLLGDHTTHRHAQTKQKQVLADWDPLEDVPFLQTKTHVCKGLSHSANQPKFDIFQEP